MVEQYEKPEVKAGLDALAAPAGAVPRPSDAQGEARTTRLAIAKGLILKDQGRLIRELQKQHKVRIYRVSNGAQWLAEVDRPEDMETGIGQGPCVRTTRQRTPIRDRVHQLR